jgi:hypothetical protein
MLFTACVFSHQILCHFLSLALIFSFSFTVRFHFIAVAFLSSPVGNHLLCDPGLPQGSRFDSSLLGVTPADT